jgi:hypothetical protein
MDASQTKSQPDASAAYEAPSLVVVGPISKFTFGSKNNGNDGVNGFTKN